MTIDRRSFVATAASLAAAAMTSPSPAAAARPMTISGGADDPLGVRATIASARYALPARESEAAKRLLPDLQPLLASDDMREGLASFMERRPAKFTGR